MRMLESGVSPKTALHLGDVAVPAVPLRSLNTHTCLRAAETQTTLAVGVKDDPSGSQ